MKKNNNFLYGHGGSENHGCEAIVRTTACIFSNRPSVLFSYNPKQDLKYGVDSVCQLINNAEIKVNRFSVGFFKAYLAYKIHNDYERLNDVWGISALALARKNDIAISIGGDNYCYRGVERYMLCRRTLQKRGVKTVLWGCSVEPDIIEGEIKKDLSRYDLIVARETISYEALRVVNSNTILAPDPAFTLTKQAGDYPEGLGAKPYIGINVSPLIQSREISEGITQENYRALITYILEKTECDVALIPHVVWEYNDDRIPLGQLYDEFKDSGRVYMVEDQNCMQLKDIISGCEFFVGARTHATIAAYSTCVPTLVVGYSVKARGIAHDLFGSEDGYVLPVQQLRQKDDLTEAFKALYNRKDEIRLHLTNMMPNYISGIEAAKEAVERL